MAYDKDCARMQKIRTFIEMRYGRNMNDCMDDMEFMLNKIEELEKALEDAQEDINFARLYR